jgi:arabinogalactan oligomer/maltooligosaccharide transport system substrate-binding protein
MFMRLRPAALLCALVIVVGACGGSGGSSPAASVPAASVPAASVPAATVPAASVPASAAAETPATSPGATPVATPSVACDQATPSSPAPDGIPTGLSGTLTVWEAYGASGTSEHDAFCTMVANVKAANSGLTVNVLDYPFNNLFTSFETQAAAGAGPDLYIAPNDNLPTEARATLLKDLTSIAGALKAAPYKITDTALTADTVDGKLSAIPESMKAVALFYNTSTFAKPPATTDEWMTNAKKLGWVYGANGGGAYYLWGIFGAFGGKILADDGKCAAAAAGVADSLKWLSDLKKAGATFYQNDGDAKTDFLAGKIGGFIDGPWQTGDLKAALKDKLAVAPGPTGPGGAFQPMAAPDGFYINDSSPNADLAVQFAQAMIAPSNEQIFVDKAGHIPASTAITVTDPITKGFADAIKTGFPRPTAKELNNYWGNFGNALVAVIDKGTDPTTAVADACTAMDKANATQ